MLFKKIDVTSMFFGVVHLTASGKRIKGSMKGYLSAVRCFFLKKIFSSIRETA